ncbi:hypothetical protein AB0G67_47260 [Streptomyces sp. NPDC021056]|uniref:hypothetical protein n=1 Tax=Streptomyces sp. NPDC021056 TaxID=3155012 RepID=UPI0034030027
MSRHEWTLGGVCVLLLLLWSVRGQVWDLSATVSAFSGVAPGALRARVNTPSRG